jgi:hypothetical protein
MYIVYTLKQPLVLPSGKATSAVAFNSATVINVPDDGSLPVLQIGGPVWLLLDNVVGVVWAEESEVDASIPKFG